MRASQGATQPPSIIDCSKTQLPSPTGKRVLVKEASLIGQEEVRGRLDARIYPAQRVEACWEEGAFLTSSPAQVEFFVTQSTEPETCTEQQRKDVRVFSLDFVNDSLDRMKQGRLQSCRSGEYRVLCSLP
jgi:hypothetical protein